MKNSQQLSPVECSVEHAQLCLFLSLLSLGTVVLSQTLSNVWMLVYRYVGLLYTYLDINMYVRTVYRYVRMYMCTYGMYKRTYVRTYVCMCMYIYIYIFTVKNTWALLGTKIKNRFHC